MGDESNRKVRRGYRPEVEGLEVLSLLSALPAAPLEVPAEHDLPVAPVDDAAIAATADAILGIGLDSDAWDVALDQEFPAERLEAEIGPLDRGEVEVDDQSIARGLAQLDRYLGRSWARAGVPPQKHDDCTQGVYLRLLSDLGREGFDYLVALVGLLGIREVLSRETAEGPLFFRAIDTTKKRAQRERRLPSLDDLAGDPAGPRDDADDWPATIREAIARSLNPREADLIRATLRGETPAEIADRWGVAPKTVSNEKTRAFGKLRTFLLDDEAVVNN